MEEEVSEKLKHMLQEALGDQYIGLAYISNNIKNDMDYILVVRNDSNKFSMIKLYTNVAVFMTKQFGIFISVYPVLESELQDPQTMFLQNVKEKALYV